MNFIKIEIERQDNKYAVGSLSYCEEETDVVYRPSHKISKVRGIYHPKSGFHNKDIGQKNFDHITIHSNGKINVKDKRGGHNKE